MKILQVIDLFAPQFGGVATAIYNLSEQLSKFGHGVTIITTDLGLDTNYIASMESKGVNVIYFPCKFNLFSFLYSPSMKKWLKENINEFDIVHIHNFRSYQNYIVSNYSKRAKIPYILQANGSLLPFFQKIIIKKIFDLFVGNKILNDAEAVLSLTKSESREYEMMGVSPKKIKIIPNSIDPYEYDDLISKGEFRTKYHISDHKKIILFLGRIHKIKGIDFLLEGFNKLCDERNDVLLTIVGPDDGYKSVLEQVINGFDIRDKVIFTGILTGDEKIAALYDANMLVQTSIYERGPGSPFEAVLCGTPIIVTKNTGAGDIVEKINAGFLVDYGDVKGLKDLMEEIINEPQRAQEKTEAAKNYIINNLNWKVGIKEYENIYQEVIRQRDSKNGF
jgi:glycosyltransferase involved in cell wall biosynthesis